MFFELGPEIAGNGSRVEPVLPNEKTAFSLIQEGGCGQPNGNPHQEPMLHPYIST